MTTRTLSDLAALCGAALEGDGDRAVEGPASLDEAGPEHVSFLANPRYEPQLGRTRAAGVLVGAGVEAPRADLTLLRVEDPGAAFTQVILAFTDPPARPTPGVAASAVVSPDARLGEDVHVGAHAVVGPDARLGDRVVVGAGCVVGEGCVLGEDTRLHPRVVLYPGVHVGARCVLHAGAVLGSDGFGFDFVDGAWNKVPQCGGVVLEDDVEVGANCTVDRARFGQTRIGRGSKLDNLVHIAHNVVVEEGALVIAQVGIAGSARIGRGAILAGQSGVAGHAVVGPGARLGGRAAVYGDLPGGEDYIGEPARPRKETLRRWAEAKRTPARVAALEARLDALERRAGTEDAP